MASAFHWVKVKTICYATENEDVLHEMMTALTGVEEFEIDISEGLHGNPIIVIDAVLTHNKEFENLFKALGKDVVEQILSEIDDRVDDDCVMYARLDKQKAVQGEYVISHAGDVISITGKVVAHPAKKENALINIKEFLTRILQSAQAPSSQ